MPEHQDDYRKQVRTLAERTLLAAALATVAGYLTLAWMILRKEHPRGTAPRP